MHKAPVGETSVVHSAQRQCFQTIASDHKAVQKAPLPRGSEQSPRKVDVYGLEACERYDQEPRVNTVATRAHDESTTILAGRCVGESATTERPAVLQLMPQALLHCRGGVEMNQTCCWLTEPNVEAFSSRFPLAADPADEINSKTVVSSLYIRCSLEDVESVDARYGRPLRQVLD